MLRNFEIALLHLRNIANCVALVKMSKQIDQFKNAQRNFENAQISIMRGTYPPLLMQGYGSLSVCMCVYVSAATL